MADTKSTAKSQTVAKSEPTTAGWDVITQATDPNTEGLVVSTRHFSVEGPNNEAAARKQIEEGLGDHESLVTLSKTTHG